jgi:hypothetical protein
MYGRRYFGQCGEVCALVGGQLQRVCEGIEHRAGDSAGAALLQPHDIVDAHVGELGELLPAQARYPALPAVV